MRHGLSLFAVLLSLSAAFAGGESLNGRWKLSIFEDGKTLNFWLLNFESKDGKVVGGAETIAKIPRTKVADFAVVGELVQFDLKLENGVVFRFEGKLPQAGGKKILGSITRNGLSTPAAMEATKAKDAMEINAELLTRTPNDPRVFNTLFDLIDEARERKLPARDVQEWVDVVSRSAEAYGPTWQAEYGIKLVKELQQPYPAIAAGLGLKLEKSYEGRPPNDGLLRLLSATASALSNSGQADAAAAIGKRLEQAEAGAYEEYAKKPRFKTEKFAGKANRPVLIELFTGAQCPPCVAADVGFDGLEKAFGDAEVVLLQYHMHIPGPDPLTAAENDARAGVYAKSFGGTPAIFFNGKAMAPGGGGAEDGEEKYKEYRGIVEELVKKNPDAKLTASATRKGDEITIKASVADLAAVGPKLRLRIALTEDWVRYRGGNGMVYHHRVVRAMPGGPEGFVLAEKSMEKSVSLDLAAVRKANHKHLDEVAREAPFRDDQRPMRMRDLRAVVFVQDDATGDVLNALSVKVVE